MHINNVNILVRSCFLLLIACCLGCEAPKPKARTLQDTEFGVSPGDGELIVRGLRSKSASEQKLALDAVDQYTRFISAERSSVEMLSKHPKSVDKERVRKVYATLVRGGTQQLDAIEELLVTSDKDTQQALAARHEKLASEMQHIGFDIDRRYSTIDIGSIESSKVEVLVTGSGLTGISIRVYNNDDKPISVRVPAGMIFRNNVEGVQDMITLAETRVLALPGMQGRGDARAACANMQKKTPDGGHTFKPIPVLPTNAQLRMLIESSAFKSSNDRVKQFAVWTITDNPARNQFVGIGQFGFGGGPGEAEVAEIRRIFRDAGLSTDSFRLFSR